MGKRLFGALLSALLVVEAPGFASYQAFAAEVRDGGVAPEVLTVPTLNTAAPLSPAAQLDVNLPISAPLDGARLPAAQVTLNATALPTAQASQALSGKALPEARKDGALPGAGAASVQALAQDPNVKAAVDTEHADAQAPALQKVYEGVGPKGADRAVFSGEEGQVMRMEYQPADRAARREMTLEKGKTPVHVLVGAGGHYGRAWGHDWAKAEAERVGRGEIPGLKQVVIDAEKHRPADAEHFIAHDILDMSAENKKALSDKLIKYLDDHHMTALGANTTLQGYSRMVPAVQQAIKQFNNPSILVHPAAAVEAAADKMLTRVVVGERIESLKWPAASPGAVDDPDIEEKAVRTFREIVAKTPSKKAVLKLQTAAGKAGLRVGIGSEEEMREAVRSVKKEITEYWGAHPEERSIYIESEKNGPSRFLIEGMIDRLAEGDAELNVAVNKDGTLSVMGFIIGNPDPGDKEKGYLFGMNGLLSPELQRAVILAMTEAVVAAWGKFGGLPFGNFHMEFILRGDPSAPEVALVEINAIRPIGGNGVRLAKEWHGEINLIANGLRASLGLPLVFPETQPTDSLLALGITPAVSGTITKIDETPGLAKADGFAKFGNGEQITKKTDGPIFLQLSELGEKVEGADSVHPGGLGAMVGRGADANAAVKNVLAGLRQTGYEITKPDGTVYKQNGAEEHSEADYRALPEAPRDELGLTPKARAELDKYEEAQVRWTPIFRVYGPIFSALMNMIGGGLAAIGIGRLGYTLALALSGPFASVLASKMSVRDILKYTWLGRIAIWAVGVPLAVLLIPPAAVAFTVPALTFSLPLVGAVTLGGGVSWLMVSLFGLNFLDGLMVSFSHPVDWDAFGMDQVAKQNGFQDQMQGKTGEKVRDHYNSRMSAWSAKATMIFPTAIALGIMGAAALAMPLKWAFVAGMAGVFVIQGGRAVMSVVKLNEDVALEKATKSTWAEFKEGVAIVKNDAALRKLVALDSLERGLVDALMMVAFPLLGLFAIRPSLHLNEAGANLASTLLIAVMMFSAMKASQFFRKHRGKVDPNLSQYDAQKKFFPLMFVAGLTTLSIPAAFMMMAAGLPLAGLAVAALGIVAFMAAFKPAQLTVMGMMQSAGSAHEGSARIAGISSAIQMVVSGLVVWALESLFPALPATGFAMGAAWAFLGVSLFCIFVGAMYWKIWPTLASKTPPPAKKG